MQSELLAELKTIGTSNQWSVMTGVLAKLNKKLSDPLNQRQFAQYLSDSSQKQLNEAGIFVESFGPHYMPIICINPPLGRQNQKKGLERECECQLSNKNSGDKYFGSHSYNAGRHDSKASDHNLLCVKWRPRAAGHLHSWRRGFSKA